MKTQQENFWHVWVGTYATAEEESFFLCKLYASGKMEIEKGFKGGEKTSYMAFPTNRQLLFLINEAEDYEEKGGAVVSFRYGDEWEIANRVYSGGKLPVSVCYVEEENSVLVANYTSGTIAVIPVTEGGELAAPAQIIQHVGGGPNKERQASPHAHQVIQSPDKRFLFAVDLGMDQIKGYVFREGKLQSAASSVAYHAGPGTGPRQLVFHPDGKHAFLVHEIKSLVSFLKYHPDDGVFEEISTVSAIPNDYKGENKCGGIVCSPDGKTVYVTNRGHDSIAVFPVDVHTKSFSLRNYTYAQGHWPRELCIAPDGQLLMVTCQKSNVLTTFHINPLNGELQFTGYKTDMVKPVFCAICSK